MSEIDCTSDAYPDRARDVIERETAKVRNAAGIVGNDLPAGFDGDVRKWRKELREIASRIGRGKDAQPAIRKHLQAGSTRRVASVRSLASRPGLSVRTVAKRCDPFRVSDEPIRWKAAPKADGTVRMIGDPGVIRRAIDFTSRPIWRLYNAAGPRDFGARGGAKAAAQTVQAILDAGYHHVVVADVASCFDTIRLADLAGVIPSSLLRGSTNSEKGNGGKEVSPREYSGEYGGSAGNGLRCAGGLIQGGLISPDVTLALVGWLISHSRRGAAGKVVIYRDDIFTGFTSESEAKSFEHALKKTFYEHTGGRLTLNLRYINAEKRRFDFCRYRFRSKMAKTISSKSENKILLRYLNQLPTRNAETYLSQATSQFAWIGEHANERLEWLSMLATHHYYTGLDASDAVRRARAGQPPE